MWGRKGQGEVGGSATWWWKPWSQRAWWCSHLPPGGHPPSQAHCLLDPQRRLLVTSEGLKQEKGTIVCDPSLETQAASSNAGSSPPPTALSLRFCREGAVWPEELRLRLPCGHQAHRLGLGPSPLTSGVSEPRVLGGREKLWESCGLSSRRPAWAPGCLWPVGSWWEETASCHHGTPTAPTGAWHPLGAQ